MWNIYSAFELVYTERWKRLPNLGFKKKKTKSTMVVKRKTHWFLSCLAQIYSADPGKICAWIKNRFYWNSDETTGLTCSQEHFRVLFRALSNPQNLLKSSLPENEEKHSCTSRSKSVKSCIGPPKALVTFVKYHNLFSFYWLISLFLFQTYFALASDCVTCCYLSQPETLMWIMAAQDRAMATGVSRLITFLFLLFTVSSKPRCRGM